MKSAVSVREMKELDAHTIHEIGVPSCVLMERAALAVADEVIRGRKEKERILVVCGTGNNGGDGIAAARILRMRGMDAEICFPGAGGKMTEETARQWQVAENYGMVPVNNPKWDAYTTIVDAIFGVGLSRPVEGLYGDLIRKMNASGARKIAVDIPSGIDGDTGRVLGAAFRADVTVTFAFRKKGLCLYPGRYYAGHVVTADIGIYECGEKASVRYMERADLALLPERVPWGNKGTFGKVLMVTGSPGMCGASYLSAAAALRTGAGMVKIQTAEENRIPLQTLLPEAMVSVDMSEEGFRSALDWCDLLVIGPGLGMTEESSRRAEWFLKNGAQEGKTVILDADGLNLLAQNPGWREYLGPHVTVTPHVGEMARLCGCSAEDIRGKTETTAVSYAREAGVVCVLKDACTVTADPSGAVYLNLSGNAGMATAGSGDVLSGMLAGIFCMFRSRGTTAADNGRTAALGVYFHGLCGDAAAQRRGMRGMTAGDLVSVIPDVLRGKEVQ